MRHAAYNHAVVLSTQRKISFALLAARRYVPNKIDTHGRSRSHAAWMPRVVSCARSDIRWSRDDRHSPLDRGER